MIMALLIYSIDSHRTWSETNNLIHNPAFTGTVVGRETTIERFTPMGPGFTVYRLHIVGEYFGGYERIQVDHIFVVSEDIFRRFEIGDIISNEQD